MGECETTKYERSSSTRNKTELLCQGAGINDGCRDVLMHISASIDRIDNKLTGMQLKLAKGDPEMTTKLAVIDDRVAQHGKILATLGGLIAAQAVAIVAQLLIP